MARLAAKKAPAGVEGHNHVRSEALVGIGIFLLVLVLHITSYRTLDGKPSHPSAAWGWPPISIFGDNGGSATKREEDVQFREAEPEADGNHEEEARWANVIDDILKQRGEYVEAFRWLHRDYKVSTKHLPQKQLLPTFQSLGEVYFRLERFKEALTYQNREPAGQHAAECVYLADAQQQ
ncbi:hypothetical protein Taro_026546 [Colocasia esculenta]|uniref:Uncharacterized protein n=1 Tax=Colocasia esculenta TaxID=4460 RepID=A0A843VKX2_COLES|nr:hypothetical protein [Colocasia esculenta]